jgi:hypothetical protein
LPKKEWIMARFFFHVINGDFYPDTHGIECTKPEDVKQNAVRIAGEMLRDQGLALWRTRHYDMFVCDEANKTHLKLSFVAEDLSQKES